MPMRHLSWFISKKRKRQDIVFGITVSNDDHDKCEDVSDDLIDNLIDIRPEVTKPSPGSSSSIPFVSSILEGPLVP